MKAVVCGQFSALNGAGARDSFFSLAQTILGESLKCFILANGLDALFVDFHLLFPPVGPFLAIFEYSFNILITEVYPQQHTSNPFLLFFFCAASCYGGCRQMLLPIATVQTTSQQG